MYTKEQRHEIYKQALDEHLVDKIQSIEADWPMVGLRSIFESIGADPHGLSEFMAHRPKGISLTILWWPNHPGDPNRERVLRDCIEKTKP